MFKIWISKPENTNGKVLRCKSERYTAGNCKCEQNVQTWKVLWCRDCHVERLLLVSLNRLWTLPRPSRPKIVKSERYCNISNRKYNGSLSFRVSIRASSKYIISFVCGQTPSRNNAGFAGIAPPPGINCFVFHGLPIVRGQLHGDQRRGAGTRRKFSKSRVRQVERVNNGTTFTVLIRF